MSDENDEMQNHPLFRIFNLGRHQPTPEEEEQNFQNHKGFLTPIWREVVQKNGSPSYFVKFSQGIAQHVASCTDPSCPHNNSIGHFMTPKLFVSLMCERLKDFSTSEATALIQMWMDYDLAVIERDPRYIIFKAQWDTIMATAAIVRESTPDPFKGMIGQ